ncbi:endoglucanase [Lentibacillus halodurans]|uniref:Endoglucanase n=1 Tax=Lentibacillus halodurans TaxID=237679 RepID=A0A1I1A578_9BACI|nr:M42 family metallopeptidase [Lentibacillus halodurans]SFB33184.1 endoglucanase [Lentibacillus halodurans]
MDVLLNQLTRLNGPSGYEQNVAYFIKDYVSERADHIHMDSMGNVVARKRGKTPGPVTLLTAHMDEVGFIVKKIEEDGLLRFEKLGGHDDRILLAQEVKVLGNNQEIDGVIGTMGAHYVKFDDAQKVRSYTQLYIDVGAGTKQEVQDMGIEVGTPVTWSTETKHTGPITNQIIIGKALDDRAGCAVLLSVLNDLQENDFAGELIFLFTVQEEVGLRGAQTAIHDLQVDAAIAVDATVVSDTPEQTMDQSLQLGKGTGIKVMDSSLIVQKTMKDLLKKVAVESSIRYQMEIFTGIGTDGGAVALANKSIPTGVLSIPSRNAHSPVEVVNKKDLAATCDLLKAFILNLDKESNFAF